MKFKGREHADWSEEAMEAVLDKAEREWEKEKEAKRPAKKLKADHIKAAEWLKLIIPGIEKMDEKQKTIFPIMQTIKGSKSKVQFETYSEKVADIEQIFDNYGHVFRSKAQLNALAHYIGTSILQWKFIVMNGKGLSVLSQRIAEQEPKRNFRGTLMKLHDEIKLSIDHYHAGIIDNKELCKEMNEFVEIFKDKEERVVARRYVETLVESGEVERGRVRSAVRTHRKAKFLGLQLIDGEKGPFAPDDSGSDI